MTKKSGCWVSDGKRSIELDIGWYKGWLFENVYGWQFHGPIDLWPLHGPYVNLVVLDHEPPLEERRAIERHFADAVAPDGTTGKRCPLGAAA